MIDVVDYGGGNLFSVVRALEFLGAEPQIIKRPEDHRGEKLIIPGVGAFGDAMLQLRQAGFVDCIHEHKRAQKPLLGICLGMQLFFAESEESAGVPGLQFYSARVVRFPATEKVPHMGWNQLRFDGSPRLLRDIASGSYVYFAHSYGVPAAGSQFEAATTLYSMPFVAVVEHGNIFGVQFHPEKSQKVGMQILKNFVEL